MRLAFSSHWLSCLTCGWRTCRSAEYKAVSAAADVSESVSFGLITGKVLMDKVPPTAIVTARSSSSTLELFLAFSVIPLIACCYGYDLGAFHIILSLLLHRLR